MSKNMDQEHHRRFPIGARVRVLQNCRFKGCCGEVIEHDYAAADSTPTENVVVLLDPVSPSGAGNPSATAVPKPEKTPNSSRNDRSDHTSSQGMFDVFFGAPLPPGASMRHKVVFPVGAALEVIGQHDGGLGPHPRPAPDRWRLRREYRGKKAEIYMRIGYFIFSIGMIFWLAISVIRLAGGVSPGTGVSLGLGFLLLLVLVWRFVKSMLGQAKKIPYVPPVTIGTLPDEEILVRGVKAPSTPADVLLRPTGQEKSSAAELLRMPDESRTTDRE
jgi:hypothetical protein